MDDRYKSRKFRLAAFFAAVSTIALFTHFIEGGVFASLVGLILGLYGASNVMENNKSINN